MIHFEIKHFFLVLESLVYIYSVKHQGENLG